MGLGDIISEIVVDDLVKFLLSHYELANKNRDKNVVHRKNQVMNVIYHFIKLLIQDVCIDKNHSEQVCCVEDKNRVRVSFQSFVKALHDCVGRWKIDQVRLDGQQNFQKLRLLFASARDAVNN